MKFEVKNLKFKVDGSPSTAFLQKPVEEECRHLMYVFLASIGQIPIGKEDDSDGEDEDDSKHY